MSSACITITPCAWHFRVQTASQLDVLCLYHNYALCVTFSCTNSKPSHFHGRADNSLLNFTQKFHGLSVPVFDTAVTISGLCSSRLDSLNGYGSDGTTSGRGSSGRKSPGQIWQASLTHSSSSFISPSARITVPDAAHWGMGTISGLWKGVRPFIVVLSMLRLAARESRTQCSRFIFPDLWDLCEQRRWLAPPVSEICCCFFLPFLCKKQQVFRNKFSFLCVFCCYVSLKTNCFARKAELRRVSYLLKWM